MTAHGTLQLRGQWQVVPSKGATHWTLEPPGPCRGQSPQLFALPWSCGCPSPGLSLAEVLQIYGTCGYHQPFPDRHLQGAASLHLPSFFPHHHLEKNVLMPRSWEWGGERGQQPLPFMPWCIWYKNCTWDKPRVDKPRDRSPAPGLQWKLIPVNSSWSHQEKF